MLNKPTLIAQIGFVIPNEFKDVGQWESKFFCLQEWLKK